MIYDKGYSLDFHIMAENVIMQEVVENLCNLQFIIFII